MASERDELARLLAVSNGTEWDHHPGGADDRDPYYRDADAILTSDWLAAHDAEIREQIARGIEELEWDRPTVSQYMADGGDTHYVAGRDSGIANAARIARGGEG